MALTSDFMLASYVGTAVAATLALGFSLPALTEPDTADVISTAANVEQNVLSEARYCESNLSGVNCACFAAKSGQVMGHKSYQYLGAAQANQTELARSQARRAC